ncbi:MAG: electron transfer flavoprotein subunit alpha/FixB family protein [Chloroflexi bacterium]|jgi:electron transfer flavoprotein alpha subunit|nr:electron transfer flavoprotein subunit alpha/FixB family protein [Chloroflexota bacterium]
MNSWVYIDHFKGNALPASWETIGVGKTLGNVTALVFGSGIEALAKAAFEYGADEVLLADDAALADYRAEAYATTLSKLSAERTPDLLLFPTTTRGRELAGMVAIDLRTGVMVDVTSLEATGGKITVTRPIYAGKLLTKETCSSRPQIITLRGRAFPKPAQQAGKSGTLTKVAAAIGDFPTKVEGYTTSESGVSLTDASVIVSGGRGVSNNPALTPPAGLDEKQAEIWRAQQGFALVIDLASALGAAVGASRAAVDAGYVPYTHQVGQTGKVVSPDVYIACGISGAIQHLAGMRTSKVIVSINKDPEAPIFKLARYGVVGDLFQIVPALTVAFKKKMGK